MPDNNAYERLQQELDQLREDVNGYIVEATERVRDPLQRHIDDLERQLESLRGDVRDLEHANRVR